MMDSTLSLYIARSVLPTFVPSVDVQYIESHADNDIRVKTGNAELLEAAVSCDEILPTGRRPRRPAAAEFHLWILGGRSGVIQCVLLNYAQLTFLQGRN